MSRRCKRDFQIDMGRDHATRLMIVKGDFESVSMAIYGDVVADSHAAPQTLTYEPRALSSITPAPLPPVLDPANTRDPSQLARQLLKLIPDAPELELVIRLVFCLKPSNDDWDLPDFPYLHPDLDNLPAELDLEKALRLTTRPVPDDISPDTVSAFAQKVAQSIDLKVFAALSDDSQWSIDTTNLMDATDLLKIFTIASMEDETTLARLLYAAANADVARRLDRPEFLELLSSMASDYNTNRDVRSTARRLLARLRGWSLLEDAFSNTQGDFIAAASTLKDIGTEEQSFGIWLESMIAHDDIVSSLTDNPVLPVTLPRILLHRASFGSPSQDEFIAFIVNHLLLLRQMTFRLECMTDNDPPTPSGIDAEHILVDLAKDPTSFLRSNFVKSILNIGTSTSVITDDERSSMRQAAFIVDDGFSAAVDELLRPVERPPSFSSLRTLRVALAYIERELDEDEESRVLDDFWEDAKCSLSGCLSDVLAPLLDEIRSQFSLLHRPPPNISQDVVAHLFWAIDDIFRLFLRLIPVSPLPSRVLRALTTQLADTFACTDAADMRYSQSSPPSLAAQETRQSCIDLIRVLGNQPSVASGAKPSAQLVLRVLLEHGLQSEGLDPTHHLLQVFYLIDSLLPEEDCAEHQRALWIQSVIPTVLKELRSFCRALDTENKVHFIRRLSMLDRGAVGVGEWLLLEEVKDVSRAIHTLRINDLSEHKRRVVQNQIALFFRFFADILRSSSAEWCTNSLAATEEAPHLLATILTTLFDSHLAPPHLVDVLDNLAAVYDVFDNELRWAIVLGLWRSIQPPELSDGRLEQRLKSSIKVLETITTSYLDPVRVTAEIGSLLVNLAQRSDVVDESIAQAVVSLLEWLARTTTSVPKMGNLQTISSEDFGAFRDRLKDMLTVEWKERLDAACCELVLGNASAPLQNPTTVPESVELSIHDIEELIRQNIPMPSTPPRRPLNQDVLGLVTVSPPAILRSPAVIGLTKTYQNNDFRQLRQTTARANTSRLPSMHVDDFESASSPTLDPLAVPVQTPTQAAAAMQYIPEAFPQLGPAFSPI
ncbi:hypothetical protein BN946_scf184759.g8 [Trametes cinnabarina]|uniref:Virilizer N-terminal domain-containing protein n=1 Tax=Pycnoporus cinnabarinus TaxID=5643 RepID=A0A060SB01_PYCCI|nr:hypothetical protein BN946_scf184759.g8 [Trametes cinnabarina]